MVHIKKYVYKKRNSHNDRFGRLSERLEYSRALVCSPPNGERSPGNTPEREGECYDASYHALTF